MGIDVKQDFLRQAEERLANILTATDMKAAQREICDELDVESEKIPTALLDTIEDELEAILKERRPSLK